MNRVRTESVPHTGLCKQVSTSAFLRGADLFPSELLQNFPSLTEKGIVRLRRFEARRLSLLGQPSQRDDDLRLRDKLERLRKSIDRREDYIQRDQAEERVEIPNMIDVEE